MRLIENATGARRVLVLGALLVITWVAAVLVIATVGAVAAAIAGGPHATPAPSPGVAEFLTSSGRSFVEIIWLSMFFTIAPLMPSSWASLPSNGVAFGMWLTLMAIVLAPTLIAVPLVGFRSRGRLPLRWSIVGGGLLGGLIGLGVIVCLLDLLRPLGWVRWLEFLPRQEWAMVLLLHLCWIAVGGIWAWALARAGRSSRPDAIARFVRRLFAGTCVELAIAAPTYALAIRRSDCWCGWGSWFAVVGGAAILTVLCGPALILLWTREARLQWVRTCCQGCGYPRRPGAAVCPECGAPSEPDAAR